MRDILTMIFAVAIAYGIYAYFFDGEISFLESSKPKTEKISPVNAAQNTTNTAVDIGTDFKLTNQFGEEMSSKQLRKRKLLVFFGFTHCPDICPAALSVMNEAYNLLGADSSMVKPVFITVDPENDSPQVIQEYLLNFSPDFLGFTGDRAEIERVVKAYKSYSNKSDDGQIMHSDLIYLMDEKGRYITHFNRENTPQEIAKTIKKHK